MLVKNIKKFSNTNGIRIIRNSCYLKCYTIPSKSLPLIKIKLLLYWLRNSFLLIHALATIFDLAVWYKNQVGILSRLRDWKVKVPRLGWTVGGQACTLRVGQVGKAGPRNEGKSQ